MNTNDLNAHNGLITKIWGPHMWIALHSITFGYPIKPTEQEKKNYKIFFEYLKYVLPCIWCRKSYSEFILENDTKLTDKDFESRETLTRWLWRLHNRVNKKLNVDYKISYEDLCYRYESMRAKCDPKIKTGCIMPLDEKAESYKISLLKEHHIIPFELALKFKNYGLKCGVKEFEYLENYQNILDNKYLNGKFNEQYIKRNKECDTIVDYMKLCGIHGMDNNGLPTINELKLIARITSTVDINALNNMKL